MTKTHFSPHLTAAQRRNLETLYLHLARVEKINMANFVSNIEGYEGPDIGDAPRSLLEVPEENICGTVCCLAGNGPLAGIKPRKSEDWWDYARRAFGADMTTSWENPKRRVWDWLFDYEWADTDNTVEGGRARIRMLLDHGIPLNHKEQRLQMAPLSYATTAS